MNHRSQWPPTSHDARIAELMISPPEETVEQQRARCAEYGCLVLLRQRELEHNPLKLALHSEGERHWWRDLGFITVPGDDHD